MLIIVIEKPIQFTIVNAVPLSCGVVLFATRLENKGESAITLIPQITKKMIKSVGDSWNMKGEIKQQKPEIDSAKIAIFLLSKRDDNVPPIIQPKLPIAIIEKDINEILKLASWWVEM